MGTIAAGRAPALSRDGLILPPAALPLMVALAGPFVGSFVAATADRLIARSPVFTARSRCDACARVLRPLDMVPLLSWLLLRGRCRGCGTRIPVRLPLAETAGLVIGVASAMLVPDMLALAGALFGWALLLLALLDLRAMWLPRIGGWGLAAAGLAVAAMLGREALRDAAIGAVAGWAVLAALGETYKRLRGREGLGEGDPPLLAAAGAWVGWMGLPLVVLIAALTGIVQALLARSPNGEPARIPFGAHMALAMWLVWLTGAPG